MGITRYNLVQKENKRLNEQIEVYKEINAVNLEKVLQLQEIIMELRKELNLIKEFAKI